MSVFIKKDLVRGTASFLAFVVLWMSGIASLTHNDACDDGDFFTNGRSKVARQSQPTAPDMCAACAWNAAGNVYLPDALVAPAEAAYCFDARLTSPVRAGIKTVHTVTPRGPPISL